MPSGSHRALIPEAIAHGVVGIKEDTLTQASISAHAMPVLPPCENPTDHLFELRPKLVHTGTSPAQPINKEFCSQLNLDAYVKQCFVQLKTPFWGLLSHGCCCCSPFRFGPFLTPPPPHTHTQTFVKLLKMAFAVICRIFAYFSVYSIDI